MELFVFVVEIIWHARFKCSVLKPDHYHSSANHLRKKPNFVKFHDTTKISIVSVSSRVWNSVCISQTSFC